MIVVITWRINITGTSQHPNQFHRINLIFTLRSRGKNGLEHKKTHYH